MRDINWLRLNTIEVFAKPEDVIKAFEHENVIMPMFVKEGTIKDVEEMCSTK